MGLLRRLLQDLTGPKSEYGVRSTTLTGEYVRSKAEQAIGDYFTKQNILYQYEKTARTNNLVFKEKISKPDFYLTQYDLYVEYWGLLDTKDKRMNSRYKKKMRYKMARYHENKIHFVSLYPDNLSNLDYVFRGKFREVKGFDLPRVSNGATRPRFCESCGKQTEPGSRFCGNCGKQILA
jgi:hypothetical protein